MELIAGVSEEGKCVIMVVEPNGGTAIPLHRISMTRSQWCKVKQILDAQEKTTIVDINHQQLR